MGSASGRQAAKNTSAKVNALQSARKSPSRLRRQTAAKQSTSAKEDRHDGRDIKPSGLLRAAPSTHKVVTTGMNQ